jgi:hypothetical protein
MIIASSASTDADIFFFFFFCHDETYWQPPDCDSAVQVLLPDVA